MKANLLCMSFRITGNLRNIGKVGHSCNCVTSLCFRRLTAVSCVWERERERVYMFERTHVLLEWGVSTEYVKWQWHQFWFQAWRWLFWGVTKEQHSRLERNKMHTNQAENKSQHTHTTNNNKPWNTPSPPPPKKKKNNNKNQQQQKTQANKLASTLAHQYLQEPDMNTKHFALFFFFLC